MIQIADIETGRSLGVGEEGELAVRGPNVMLGYFRNEEATANTIKDGWLHTGTSVATTVTPDDGWLHTGSYTYDR